MDVMKADTYQAAVNKNVNVTGVPESIQVKVDNKTNPENKEETVEPIASITHD